MSHMRARSVAVSWLEDVVVDRLVNQADLSRVDLQILVDLGAQAVGVDDDRVGEPDRTLVVQTAVGPRTDAQRVSER